VEALLVLDKEGVRGEIVEALKVAAENRKNWPLLNNSFSKTRASEEDLKALSEL